MVTSLNISLTTVRAQIRRAIQGSINEVEALSILVGSNLLVIAMLLQSHPRFQALEYLITGNSWYLTSLFKPGAFSHRELVEKLSDLTYSDDTYDRSLAAAHPAIDPAMRYALSSDPNPDVREVFARRLDLDTDEHIQLALDNSAMVASAAILDRPVVPEEVREAIMDSDYWLHQYLLAQRADLPADEFQELYSTFSPPVRSGLVRIISNTTFGDSV